MPRIDSGYLREDGSGGRRVVFRGDGEAVVHSIEMALCRIKLFSAKARRDQTPHKVQHQSRFNRNGVVQT